MSKSTNLRRVGIKKIIAIVIIIFASLLISTALTKPVVAFSMDNTEDKIICPVTIDDDFEDDCVLVVLDKYHSGAY